MFPAVLEIVKSVHIRIWKKLWHYCSKRSNWQPKEPRCPNLVLLHSSVYTPLVGGGNSSYRSALLPVALSSLVSSAPMLSYFLLFT